MRREQENRAWAERGDADQWAERFKRADRQRRERERIEAERLARLDDPLPVENDPPKRAERLLRDMGLR